MGRLAWSQLRSRTARSALSLAGAALGLAAAAGQLPLQLFVAAVAVAASVLVAVAAALMPALTVRRLPALTVRRPPAAQLLPEE